jgi:nucleoside-diphosphate kinase
MLLGNRPTLTTRARSCYSALARAAGPALTFLFFLPLAVAQPTPRHGVSPVTERTLSLIKPDAVENHHIGAIIERFEKAGLEVEAIKMLHLTQAKAEAFYAVHKERPFFKDLVRYMMSGPIVALVLRGPNAIAKNRELMGATDPAKAAAGTLRKDFGESIERNAVHGSDGADTAQQEIPHFFAGLERF